MVLLFKKNLTRSIFIFFLFTISSCFHKKISGYQGKSKLEHLCRELYTKNKNVFCASGTYFNEAGIVWTYLNDSIEVYVVGKTKTKTVLKGKLSEKISLELKMIEELNDCVELDGDYIKYIVLTENGIYKEKAFLNIECLSNYNLSFLKDVEDIPSIWW